MVMPTECLGTVREINVIYIVITIIVQSKAASRLAVGVGMKSTSKQKETDCLVEFLQTVYRWAQRAWGQILSQANIGPGISDE